MLDPIIWSWEGTTFEVMPPESEDGQWAAMVTECPDARFVGEMRTHRSRRTLRQRCRTYARDRAQLSPPNKENA